MGVIGSIEVRFGANIGDFVVKSKFVKKETGLIGGIARTSSAGMFALRNSVIAVGGALAAYKISEQFFDISRSIDETAKTSRKLGLTTDRLVGLRHAADQTAGSHINLDMALQRMTRRVSEAAMETGEAQGAIKELGLDAKRLNRQSPDQIFARIADKMRLVHSESDQLRLSFKLFDSEGAGLVNTLKGGSAQLEKFYKEAQKLGSFTNEEAKNVEAMNDALDRLGKFFKGTAGKLIIDIAPAAEQAVESLSRVIDATFGSDAPTKNNSTAREKGLLERYYDAEGRFQTWMDMGTGATRRESRLNAHARYNRWLRNARMLLPGMIEDEVQFGPAPQTQGNAIDRFVKGMSIADRFEARFEKHGSEANAKRSREEAKKFWDDQRPKFEAMVETVKWRVPDAIGNGFKAQLGLGEIFGRFALGLNENASSVVPLSSLSRKINENNTTRSNAFHMSALDANSAAGFRALRSGMNPDSPVVNELTKQTEALLNIDDAMSKANKAMIVRIG